MTTYNVAVAGALGLVGSTMVRILEEAGGNLMHVGRVREDFSTDNGLNFWVVSDNVRNAAAQNAVQIAQLLVERGYLDEWRGRRQGEVAAAAGS